MAIESIASVKGHFETGDVPTQAEFEGLIDTLGRATPLAIASAAEGGKTGLYEILGDADVTARETGAVGLILLSAASTTRARDALGISSVASIFLDAATTASSQSLLGISSHQATFLLSESTASSQSLLGGGTVGIAVYEAITSASAQAALGAHQTTSGTVQTTTSGTAFDFTSIPSWVTHISVLLAGVSLSATDDILVQIGDSGGIEATGYVSTGNLYDQSTTQSGANSTTGFIMRMASATGVMSAKMDIDLIDSANNTWVSSHSGKTATDNAISGGGNKSLSDTLTQLRITRTGTDTFDAGSVNIIYW